MRTFSVRKLNSGILLNTFNCLKSRFEYTFGLLRDGSNTEEWEWLEKQLVCTFSVRKLCSGILD